LKEILEFVNDQLIRYYINNHRNPQPYLLQWESISESGRQNREGKRTAYFKGSCISRRKGVWKADVDARCNFHNYSIGLHAHRNG